MRRTLVSLILLLAAVIPLAAQYAAVVSEISESDRLDPHEALWLAGSASGSLPVGIRVDEAAGQLSALGLSLGRPERDARSDTPGGVTVRDFALLLMRVRETSSGFWFGIAPTPFTAYRHLRGVGVIRDDAPPSTVLDGASAIELVRRYLDYADDDDGRRGNR